MAGKTRAPRKLKALKRKAKKAPILKDVVFATMLGKTIRKLEVDHAEMFTKLKRLAVEASEIHYRIDMLRELLSAYETAVIEQQKGEK